MLVVGTVVMKVLVVAADEVLGTHTVEVETDEPTAMLRSFGAENPIPAVHLGLQALSSPTWHSLGSACTKASRSRFRCHVLAIEGVCSHG